MSRTEHRSANGSTMITRTTTSGGGDSGGGISSNMININMGGGMGRPGGLDPFSAMMNTMMGGMGGVQPHMGGGGIGGPMVTLHSFGGDHAPQAVPLFGLMGGMDRIHGQGVDGRRPRGIDELGGFGGLLRVLMAGAGGGGRGLDPDMTRDPQHEGWWQHRLRGAGQDEINNLPSHRIEDKKGGKKGTSALTGGEDQEGHGQYNDQQCQVCLEEFKSGDDIRTLPCLHIYHKKCIDQWLVRNRTCPICKEAI